MCFQVNVPLPARSSNSVSLPEMELLPEVQKDRMVLPLKSQQAVSDCAWFSLLLFYFLISWFPVDHTCCSLAAAGVFCAMTPTSLWGT